RGFEELNIADAGDGDRILVAEKQTIARALFRLFVEQVFAAEGDAAAGHGVMRIGAEYARQRAFAGTVRTHDGVHFTGFDVQVQAFDDFLAIAFVSGDGDVQVGNFQHVQFPVFSSFSPWERGGD